MPSVRMLCITFTSLFLFATSLLFCSNHRLSWFHAGSATLVQLGDIVGEPHQLTSQDPKESTWAIAPWQSLTAILPVTENTVLHMNETLQPLLRSSTYLTRVVVICPESIVFHVRQVLQQTFVFPSHLDQTEVLLRPWTGQLDTNIAILRVASHVSADWVLVLDERGLLGVTDRARHALFHPQWPPLLDSSHPYLGPWRLVGKGDRLAFPLVIRQSFLDLASNRQNIYARVTTAEGISQPSLGTSNIFILNQTYQDNIPHPGGIPTPQPASHSEHTGQGAFARDTADHRKEFHPSEEPHAYFGVLLPTMRDLRYAAPLLCRMQSNGTAIRVLVDHDEEIYEAAEPDNSESTQCKLDYDFLTGSPSWPAPHDGETLLEWLTTFQRQPDVILALREVDPVIGYLLAEHIPLSSPGITIIRFSREDLPFSEWMASLTLAEWKNWHIPRIDISIITRDRPESLQRLLLSISKAMYFGDHLDLRINIEQDCDEGTLKTVENFSWAHGQAFIHHRVIHGGLLAAVVESWYPKNNHTYGLLLEDDIELSPLYYAWIKMAVLRYRHGEPRNNSPNMFGVSLYQQKILELPPQGRQAFDPRSLFLDAGMPQLTIPYLSQIPCSWGAVYFPEHWREFHDYLAIRLSALTMPIGGEVVPNVRSNRWSKSWKKFFIELVYLRGYTMLYPNYEGFVSLSTNHLEVGSHVKARSQQKQETFLLPLMQLPKERERNGLLDLPNQTLPDLHDLPVLNLTGSLSSQESVVEVGRKRRTQLLQCKLSPQAHSIRSFMCIDTHVTRPSK